MGQRMSAFEPLAALCPPGPGPPKVCDLGVGSCLNLKSLVMENHPSLCPHL